MPFDFGPEPIQSRGYRGGDVRPWPRAGLLPPSTAVDFYYATRAQVSSFGLSALSVALPLLLFTLALALADWLLTATPLEADRDATDQAQAGVALFEKFCASGISATPLVDAILGAVAHYAWAHVALIGACLLALAGGAIATQNVLGVHEKSGFNVFAFAWGLPIVAGLILFALGQWLFGGTIAGAFHRLDLLTSENHDCLRSAAQIGRRLAWQADIAMRLVCIAVAALISAAAVIAWRFEVDDIDGPWSDTYVLRHKLKSLLTLFFLGSVLLVVSNLALSALTDVTGAVLAEAATAFDEAKEAKPDAGAPSCLIFCFTPAATEAKANAEPETPTATQARPPDVKETLAQIKALRGALLGFAGALASLLLISIFVPAFYSLTGDIELAGRTHASADSPSPPAPAPVPDGWVTLIQTATHPPRTLLQASSSIAGRPDPDPPASPGALSGRRVEHGAGMERSPWARPDFRADHRQLRRGARADPVERPARSLEDTDRGVTRARKRSARMAPGTPMAVLPCATTPHQRRMQAPSPPSRRLATCGEK